MGVLPVLWYGSCALGRLPPSRLPQVHGENHRPAASVDETTVGTLCCSFVLPYLTYCVEV